MGEILFATALRRVLASAILGLIVSFVIGSFLSFFVFFTSQAVEGQSNDTAKSIVFRVYSAVFLLSALAIHLYGSLSFRSLERKAPLEVKPPRPAICAAIAVLFLLLNAFPSTTEVKSDSFEYAEHPMTIESEYGWPAYYLIRRDEHGKKETIWKSHFLFVNALVLVLAMGNVLAFDPASRTEEVEEEAEKDEKPKKDDDDPDDPSVPPPGDAPDYRKSLTKDKSSPETLSLD